MEFLQARYFGGLRVSAESGFDELEVFEHHVDPAFVGDQDSLGIDEILLANELNLHADLLFGFDELVGPVEPGIIQVMFAEGQSGLSVGYHEAKSHDSWRESSVVAGSWGNLFRPSRARRTALSRITTGPSRQVHSGGIPAWISIPVMRKPKRMPVVARKRRAGW